MADYVRAVVRGAGRGDLSAMVALEASCFTRAGERFSRRQLRGLLNNPRAAAFVAVEPGGDAVLGYAVVLLRRSSNGTESARLYALAVDPAARGRGLGEALLRRAMDEAANRGAARVSLEVRADNAAAIALYRRLGFGGETRLPDYYEAGIDGLRMRRDLPSAV